MTYQRPPPPQAVIDRHVCEPGDTDEGLCMAYWCQKPVGPPCPASIQPEPGSHCIHWEESRDRPCCVCGYNGKKATFCDPEQPSANQVKEESR